MSMPKVKQLNDILLGFTVKIDSLGKDQEVTFPCVILLHCIVDSGCVYN